MGMIDASAQCTPCRKGEDGLPANEIEKALPALPEWSLVQNGKAIERRFTFRNYAQALTFVTQLSALAEAQGHHPDICFGWGYATVTFTTHAIGGLHRNDLVMAAKTNALV